MSEIHCGRLRPRLTFFAPAIVAAAPMLFAIADAAFAHATVSPDQANVASYVTATVQIPHGCDGSATTAVRVAIPEGYIRVKPQPGTHALKQPAPPMRLAEAISDHGDHDAAAKDISAMSAHVTKLGDLAISAAWARATPAGAKVGGGYLTIANAGKAPDRLVKVESTVSGRSEIHEMAVTNGVMTMRPLAQGLAIPAGETVTLKPGSVHLMLIDLKQPLKEGETFKVRLTFEKAGAAEIVVSVRSIAAAPPGDDPHDGHGNGQSGAK